MFMKKENVNMSVKTEKFKKITEKFNHEEGSTKFFVPQSRDEIAAEGKRMHNALVVPAWDEGHFAGKIVLLFMHNGKDAAPEDCIDMLVDMKKNKIVHMVGIYNKEIDSMEMLKKIQMWAAERNIAAPADLKEAKKL